MKRDLLPLEVWLLLIIADVVVAKLELIDWLNYCEKTGITDDTWC